MPLINTKLGIQLNYTKYYVISIGGGNGNNDSSTFKITKTELYVHVVTLNTEGNNKLNQLLSESESDDSTKSSKLKELSI